MGVSMRPRGKATSQFNGVCQGYGEKGEIATNFKHGEEIRQTEKPKILERV